jgi:hypothetical protein
VNLAESENKFSQFRYSLYNEHFNNRNDALLDLVDALSANTQFRSVAELSLSPAFSRDYNSLYKAITQYQPLTSLAALTQPFLPPLWKGKYRLLGVDTTPCARPYAYKLSQRECVYQPTSIQGQKPITYGHTYSEVCVLPPRSSPQAPRWVNPLEVQRVTRSNQETVTIQQIRSLLENPHLPFHREQCLLVGDTHYSTPTFLAALAEKTNLITIVRSRSNRVYDFQAPSAAPSRRGHVRWYAGRMDLKDPSSWPQPDNQADFVLTNYRGHTNRVEMLAWYKLVMRDQYQPVPLPLHRYPFTLIRVRLFNARNELLEKPLWLIVMGQRRDQISLPDILEAFLQRSDLEHFFRFAKQRLLLDQFQTPETVHEENWHHLVHLAYLQLGVARELAVNLPRPWERYLPQVKEKYISPTIVQRNFSRIIRQLGTPAKKPQRRGYSPGRPQGMLPALRKDLPLMVKQPI